MPAKDSVFEKVGKTFATEKISRRVQGMAVSAHQGDVPAGHGDSEYRKSGLGTALL